MKKEKYFRLNKEETEALAQEYGTPLLVLSLEQIEKNYRLLRTHLPRVKVFYAIKANPHRRILELMRDLGSNFDVASDGEIMELSSLGVDGSRMIYANPMKTVNGLRACRNAGVGKMTFDSAGEIDKMARECPGATVLLRIRIDNSSAHVDLNKKFGAAREQALELLLKARDAGLDAAGIAFHVGSQTTSADPYLYALDIARAESDLSQIKEELTEYGYIKKHYTNKKGQKAQTKSKPFHYISSDGFDIFVGKNNYQNDELTFKMATGNDWWFHAKKMAGSHVVVKTPDGELPDRTFEEAGRLAAYYSKGRTAPKVEIDYIQKKHVKKPGGAKPGFVVYYTNYSLMAAPDISDIKEAPRS